jgi:hypothetical protein
MNGPGAIYAGYSDDERPFLSYGLLAAAFNAWMATLVVAARRSGALPERVSATDVLLVGAGTHKLSRLLAKDRVTSFLRAPFTRYEGEGGPGEVEEEARGRGLQRALGELLICPYCVGLWVAGGFTTGLVFAPRETRLVAALFASLAASDTLQLLYKGVEERA